MHTMNDAEDLAGSHSLARAQRDWPIRERLLAIAAEQSEPILREALVDLTANNLQASLVGVPGRRPDIVMRFGRGLPLPFSIRRPVEDVLV